MISVPHALRIVPEHFSKSCIDLSKGENCGRRTMSLAQSTGTVAGAFVFCTRVVNIGPLISIIAISNDIPVRSCEGTNNPGTYQFRASAPTTMAFSGIDQLPP